MTDKVKISCVYCIVLLLLISDVFVQIYAQFNFVSYSKLSSRSLLKNRNCQLYRAFSGECVKSSLKCATICSEKWTCFSYQIYNDMCILCMISRDNGDLTLYSEVIPQNGLIYEKKDLPIFKDCADLHSKDSFAISDVYNIHVQDNQNNYESVHVYCDMDNGGGGWIVFQNRYDGSVDFSTTWEEFKNGFGQLNGEFWLGNDVVSSMTSGSTLYRLRIDLEDFTGQKRYAEYENFKVGSESDRYKLTIGTYSGTAGDMGSGLSYHNGMGFATKDNDVNSCALLNANAGFWYNFCDYVCLNCKYINAPVSDNTGINWDAWMADTTLKATSMKFRPMNYP